MNEREYRLLEHGSLLIGWMMALEWVVFCILYDLPLRGANAFAFLLIGIATMLVSLITWIKHRFFVQEMQDEIERHKDDPIVKNNIPEGDEK